MRVLIVVTHLLGTGHLVRALTLGRAFADAGWRVQLVSGGRAVPHLDVSGMVFVQLPPVHVEGTDFGTLYGPNGRVDSAYMTGRIQALIETFSAGPDLVITELFPFGRRVLRDEFETLLIAARARKIPVLASVRDILEPPSKASKVAWANHMVEQYYKGVLVHSDPDVIPLHASWPVSPALAARLHYTGFVAPPAPTPHPQALGQGEVLVSAGGGRVGAALFQAARTAAQADLGGAWRCLSALKLPGGQNIITGPPRRDFRSMLVHARASVSMCGYNTALDLLHTGVPAVLVPFDAGGEVEQSLRANALQRLPGIEAITGADLDGPGLLRALARAEADVPRPAGTHKMDGAARSVEIAGALLHAA